MKTITSAITFIKEVLGEIKKIVWPARAELIGATTVVLILAAFFAVILGGMDSSFGSAVKFIIGRA